MSRRVRAQRRLQDAWRRFPVRMMTAAWNHWTKVPGATTGLRPCPHTMIRAEKDARPQFHVEIYQ